MRVRIAAIAAATAALTLAAAPPPESPGDWRAKVAAPVLDSVSRGETEFLVVLDPADARTAAAGATTKAERGRRVMDALREHARRTQSPLLAWLDRHGIEHRAFWIADFVWVRAGGDVLREIAARPEVRRVDANPRVRLSPPLAAPEARSVAGIEWNVSRVEADAVWNLGYEGQGVVIAGQDTGYDWQHPALVSSYRGWNGTTASHAYNWHDAIHSGGGVCGANSLEPCDDHYHGTHTMGTMVGDDGGSNRIGVAPAARWIGCRNMDQGNGTPASYAECFQWFVAPTDLAGQNPDPALAPDVINDSWACPPSEGCAADTLRAVIENVRAAGIVVVASAGNDGPLCGSVSDPPAIYDASFSVGATDSTDTIATFSSRGPVTVDGSGRPKPDVSAPGVSVRSSVPGGSYGSLSGTSMAGPHVAGIVALLLSARPDLRGDPDTIEALIASSAVPRTTTQSCGGVAGTAVPNNTYGRGRVSALAVLQADADADGASNLDDCAPTDGAVWSAPTAARDLVLTRDGAGVALSWTAPAEPGSTAPAYDVLRSAAADDFSSAACVASGTAETTVQDAAPPPVAFYLLRVVDGCGSSAGVDGAGAPRSLPTCP